MTTFLLGWFACGNPVPTPVALPAQAEAVLKKADAHDGSVDHVVSECSNCGLMMDGSPEHHSRVENYELHFCSDACKTTFDADPAGAVEVLGKMVGVGASR